MLKATLLSRNFFSVFFFFDIFKDSFLHTTVNIEMLVHVPLQNPIFRKRASMVNYVSAAVYCSFFAA